MERIRTLDGWRGFAILLVIINHLASYPVRPGFVHGVRVGMFPVSLGGFGVDVFFVLSGYIITLRLLNEEQRTGGIDLKAFYVRRVFRILPPALIYLAVLCLLSRIVHISDFRWSDVAGSLFFFRNYQAWFRPASVYTAHFWSLAIEEHFYLFWPGLLMLCVKSKEGRRTAAAFALAGAAACAAWRHHDVATLASFHWKWVHPTGTDFPVRTDVRLDGMLLGAAGAIATSKARVRRLLERVPPIIPLLALLAALATMKFTLFHPSLLSNVLLAGAICITAVQRRGPLDWLLNLTALVWVGEISYGLYIWQQLFLLRPADGSMPLGVLNQAPWNLCASVLIAACSYYLFERRIIAAGKRWHARFAPHATP